MLQHCFGMVAPIKSQSALSEVYPQSVSEACVLAEAVVEVG